MDAGAVISSPRRTIAVAVDARVGTGGTHQLSRVVKLLNDRWALTDRGLGHLGQPVVTV